MALFLYASPFVRGIKNVKIEADCTVGILRELLFNRHKGTFNRNDVTELDEIVLVPLNPQVAIQPTQSQTEKDVYAAANKLLNNYTTQSIPFDHDLAITAFNVNDSHVVAYLLTVPRAREIIPELDPEPSAPASAIAAASGSTDRLKSLEIAHLVAIRNGVAGLAPSEVSKSETTYKKEQIIHPLYNGRPDDLHGPPIALYHPVFAKLKEQLNSIPTIVPTQEDLRLTRDLFKAASLLFNSEDERLEKMLPLVEALLGDITTRNKLQQTESRAAGDSITLINLGKVSAVTAYMEWKPELGIGGDGGLQVGLTYRKHVTQELYKPIRDLTSCPCILFVFAGAHFCVFGAMITDVVVIQPFTEFVLLGGTPDEDERVIHIASTFRVLREALATLESDYRALSLSGPIQAARLFPNPTFLDPNQTPPNLSYTGRLDYYGRLSKNYRQPIFIAELNDSRTVVVKFCRSYNADAHELLAKAGLAPALHFAAQVRGGYHMIVMDYLAKKDAYEASKSNPLHPGVRQSVEKAIMLLHENGFVFGDLRLPNIMVDANPPAAYLVDFDWVGREGQAKYPASINMSKDINWAPGVGPLATIEKEHDLYMLKNL